jgi:hypothetical protein
MKYFASNEMKGIQKGQWFETSRPIVARCLIRLGPRYTRERVANLDTGERFVVVYVTPFSSPIVFCRPLRYAALEEAFVDGEARQIDGYDGYKLGIEVTDIVHSCRPIAALE